MLVLKAAVDRALPVALLELADLLEPALAQEFLRTILSLQNRVSLTSLAEALLDGDIPASVAMLGLEAIEDELEADLPPIIRRAFQSAAEIATDDLVRPDLRGSFRFDMSNPNAVRFAEEEVGDRITEVTRDIVDSVRDSVRASVAAEVGRVDTVVRDIRDSIGLRTDQMSAVRAYRDKLLSEGVEQVDAEVRATRHAHGLLKDRALLIARTEIINALNAGAIQSWQQAAEAGWIDAAETMVEWIATPDEKTCPICAELDGQSVPLGDRFHSEELGEDIERPGAHPNCRCTVALVPLTAEQERDMARALEDLATEDLAASYHVPVLKHRPIYKYREDQSRDDHGRFADEGSSGTSAEEDLDDGDWTILAGPRAYHGTSAKRLESILKEGISTNYAGANWEESKPGTLYLSKGIAGAVAWMRQAAQERQITDRMAIVEVGIPGDFSTHLDPDENQEYSQDLQFTGNIPPEWIRHAWIASDALMGPFGDTNPYFANPKENPDLWVQVKAAVSASATVAYVPLILWDRAQAKAHLPITKYREDQSRDDHGRFANEGRGGDGGDRASGPSLDIASAQGAALAPTHYHGTSSQKLDQILREGLRDELSGKNWPILAKQGNVYLTHRIKSAQEWAQEAIAHGKTGTVAVLEIRIPPEARTRLLVDENLLWGEPGGVQTTEGLRFEGDIDPAWIVGAWRSRAEVRGTGTMFMPAPGETEFSESKWERVKSVQAADPEAPLYLAVLLQDDPEAKHGHVPVLKYREDQARDDHGRFADEGGGGGSTSPPPPASVGKLPAGGATDKVREANAKGEMYQQVALLADHRDALSAAAGDMPDAATMVALANHAGVPIPDATEAAQRIEAHAHDLLSRTTVAVRVPSERLEDIVNDGRLKTQFETGFSGGDFDPIARQVTERDAFGIPRDAPPDARPIYGYLAEDLTSARYQGRRSQDTVAHYGDVSLVLKPEVRDRTTFAGGDTLFEYDAAFRQSRTERHFGEDPNERRFVPRPLTDQTDAKLGFDLHHSRDFLSTTSIDRLRAQHWVTEAHVHGGVTLNDIQSVVVHLDHGRFGNFDATVANKLIDRGIPVKIVVDEVHGSEMVPEWRTFLSEHAPRVEIEVVRERPRFTMPPIRPVPARVGAPQAAGLLSLHVWLKYREDQARDDYGRWADEGGGRSDKPRSEYADTPRVFNTPSDVEHVRGWGNEEYWQWRARPGHLLTGQPLDRASLPEMLYHTTTNAPDVLASGVLLGQKEDAGLGGGQGLGVSLTSDATDAHVIQRELVRAVKILRGDDTVEAITAYARADEQEVGLPTGALTPAVEYALFNYHGNISNTEVYSTPESIRSATYDTLNAYLTMRGSSFGKEHPSLKNPILFGNRKSLAKLTPERIRVLSVPSRNIPASALITSGSDEFLHEVRVYADVPVGGSRVTRAHAPVVKGYPEFDPDQERDESGRWGGGGGGGGGAPKGKPADWTPRQRRTYANKLAAEAKIPTAKVRLATKDKIVDTSYGTGSAYAVYDNDKDEITLYPQLFTMDSAVDVRATFAHEALHRRISMVMKASREEMKRAEAAGHANAADDKIKDEFRDRYPVTKRLFDALGEGGPPKMAFEGHTISAYANAVATGFMRLDTVSANTLIHEIIAEVAGAKVQGRATYEKKVTPWLRKVYETFTDLYDERLAAAYA